MIPDNCVNGPLTRLFTYLPRKELRTLANMDMQTARELMEDLGHEIIDVDSLSDFDVEDLLMPKILTQVPQLVVEDVDAVSEDARRSPYSRPSTPPPKTSLKRKV
jgi:hypothetical protein